MLSILLTAQTTQQSRSFIQSRSARLLQSGKNTTTTTPHNVPFLFFSRRYADNRHYIHLMMIMITDYPNDDTNFE